MSGTFVTTGWRRVLLQVGEGHLTGKLIVDQVYAKYQHERGDLVHPRGGQVHYLREALQARYGNYLRKVAKAFISGDPEAAMAECMENLSRATAMRTPRLYGNLKGSGHPQVFSRGRKVYDRAPVVPRLSEAALRAQRRRGRRRR